MLPAASEIIDYLRNRTQRPLKIKELARELGVSAADYTEFKARIEALERAGAIYRVKKQRYAAPERINLVVGRLRATRAGDGFVEPEEGGEDVFIPARDLSSAMDGDRVVARMERRGRGPRVEGRIIKVLERAHPTVVGTYHRARSFGFVVPENRALSRDVFVPPGGEGQARDGDVVVVRLTSYGTEKLGPAGEVEAVLGPLGQPGVDILAVVYGHGLPLAFPEAVAQAARTMARTPPQPWTAGRVDACELHAFTIDPSDAKDHDDALSVQAVGEGVWEVGVHIADVSYYVEEGSELDAEAMRRGTSVYLVDRVVPLLPEELSGELCSLLPHQDRATVSLFLTVDAEGRVLRHRFARTVIRSRHRLTYEQVQRVLDGEESLDAETERALAVLRSLARALRRKRELRGSLDFDLPEARVELGEDGAPVDVRRIIRLESHRLVEEFMLLANETVARRAARRKLPFLYRVHGAPDAERIEQLRAFLEPLGYRLPGRRVVGPKDLQRVLKQAEGKLEENLVSTVVLRAMKRAEYSVENRGHFGLAARWYTHFTSPIRRYADLVVHRAVTRAFIDGASVSEEGEAGKLEVIAQLASQRERVADEAERDSVDLKKTEFMQRHVGAEFCGTISGVASFGFFVLLDDYFVEGLVHVSSLSDDYYHFLEHAYALVGERTRRRFRLGDRVRVQVAAVNLEERQTDFVLLDSN